MIQSPHFSTPEDYISKCVQFFQEFQYLYQFANTDVLIKNVFDHIDIENLDNIDVFHEGFDLKLCGDKNRYLKSFFDDLSTLDVELNCFNETQGLEDEIKVPIGPKKRHEIAYLAKEISDCCEQAKCDVVVDFGSGLGYLDQQIYETTNLKVLGLECNETNYVGAKKRQRKYHLESTERIKFIKHTINDQSDGKLKEYIEDKFGNQSFCITGLHACADLTVDAINIFLKMADAHCFILMPCCYHKMKKTGFSEVEFKNFPLSRKLKDIFKKQNCCEYMNVPFLRLGAQPPCRSDGSLEDSVFNLLARATLQLYALKNNFNLKRNKRKTVKLKTIKNNFRNYIEDAVCGFSLFKENGGVEDSKSIDCDELQILWRETCQGETLKKAAIFILMQNYLQPVVEQFIMCDRITYLKENGVGNCGFKRIFKETLSPRCLSLIAMK